MNRKRKCCWGHLATSTFSKAAAPAWKASEARSPLAALHTCVLCNMQCVVKPKGEVVFLWNHCCVTRGVRCHTQPQAFQFTRTNMTSVFFLNIRFIPLNQLLFFFFPDAVYRLSDWKDEVRTDRHSERKVVASNGAFTTSLFGPDRLTLQFSLNTNNLKTQSRPTDQNLVWIKLNQGLGLFAEWTF